MTDAAYSVSEVLDYVENMTKADPFLTNLYVEGEVSGVNYNSRGHIYFNLKDEKAAMSVAMWKSFRDTGIDFTLKDGDKVVIRGYFNLWKEPLANAAPSVLWPVPSKSRDRVNFIRSFWN